jgi:hypothetical protein
MAATGAWARSTWRLGSTSCSKPMSRHQVALLITASICILALVSWVGEIDLGLSEFLDPPAPPAAQAPTPTPAQGAASMGLQVKSKAP